MTELDLAELAVLWPRLETALGRDTAGPSAAPSGGSGGSNGSPAVIDIDTRDVMTLIEVGVHDLESQAIRLLNITPADRVLTLIRAHIAAHEQRRASSRAVLIKLRQAVRYRPELPEGLGPKHEPLTDAHRLAARAAIETIIQANEAIETARRRIERVQYRRSTLGVIEALPLWYAQLRDRNQPLAEHITEDARRWRRDARRVLRLRTAETPIGWNCPHHRGEPAELLRDGNEATLSAAVIAGTQPHQAAPLTWRNAESVHCPSCRQKWVGVEQLWALMQMINRVELEEYMTEQLANALDDQHLATTLLQCTACGGISSTEAWHTAALAERQQQEGDQATAEDLAELAAHDVCPRCKQVLDARAVEVAGVAVALP